MKEEPLNVSYIFWEPSALQKKNDKHLLVISFARIQVSLCPGKENREFSNDNSNGKKNVTWK